MEAGRLPGRRTALLGAVLIAMAAVASSARAQAPAPPAAATTAEKMDRILAKLTELEKRMDALEKGASASTTGWPLPTFTLDGLVDQIQSYLGIYLFNVYSGDPEIRMEDLNFQSEDFKQIKKQWREVWSTDQPSHLFDERAPYERAHGGIGP
jgi:hypothetical protein